MTLTETEKKTLLKIARDTVEGCVRGENVHSETEYEGALSDDCGAFVTLHKDGRLRGCIGTFISEKPLHTTVREMAVAAASEDPRFPRLTEDELDGLSIEISVISPLKKVESPEEVEVGRHGIYIVDGKSRGVLLPQVATENGFSRVEFLEQTCLKAGVDPDRWKKEASIFTFEAEVLKEDKTD